MTEETTTDKMTRVSKTLPTNTKDSPEDKEHHLSTKSTPILKLTKANTAVAKKRRGKDPPKLFRTRKLESGIARNGRRCVLPDSVSSAPDCSAIADAPAALAF